MNKRATDQVTPAGRYVYPPAAEWVQDLPGMSLERVDQIIDSPSRTHPGQRGATIYRDDRFEVVVGGTKHEGHDYVMRVAEISAPQEPPTQPSPPRRRVAGQKADTRLPLPTTVGELLDRARERGFSVDETRRHYGLTHPARPGVSTPVPRSPSDYRWAANQVSQIRNVFGVDLRAPLED